jgi:hypothetical protein
VLVRSTILTAVGVWISLQFTASASEKPPAAESESKESHAETKAAAESAPKSAEKKPEAQKPPAAAASPSAAPVYSGNYVHDWIKFPEITGTDLSSGEPMRVVPEKDYATVAFFIASYDLGSQNLIQQFKKLEATYDSRFTRFVYVFVNDLEKEAVNFIRDNKIEGRAILCDDATKTRFQFPPLNIPMIYVGDRKGWLALRFAQTTDKNIAATDEFLGLITVF